MDVIIVPLRDIELDPNQEFDLATLPEEEALARIRKAFSFLPSQADISIEDGIITVRVPEHDEAGVNEALKWYRNAVKHARPPR